MQFSSFSEFIAMGGHGFYVWLSYGISLLLLALLVISSLSQSKKEHSANTTTPTQRNEIQVGCSTTRKCMLKKEDS